jgi:phospholipase C
MDIDTRREFLKKAILLSGGASVLNSMPFAIQKALAINPTIGSTYADAEHIVILMQENRSFDHCFGTLRGVRGLNDPRAISLPDKNLVWLQTNKAGETYSPFRFDINDTKITWMGDIPHSRSSQVDADNGGRYDQWLDAKKSLNKKFEDMPLTMGFYTRKDLPFNYALADAFTICDQNFSSAMTSTWPNRLYMWAGTIRNEKNGTARAYARNDIPYEKAAIKTFPERLEEIGISWKVYQNDLATGGGFTGEERAWLANFICNILEFLPQYNVKFSSRYVKGLQKLSETLPKEITDLESRLNSPDLERAVIEKIKKDISKKKQVLNDSEKGLLRWGKESFNKLSEHQKSIYHRAFTINDGDPDFHKLDTLKYEEKGEQRELLIPKGDVLYQFRKDVDSGQLPTVSWLVPSQNFSDHPSAPWYGNWITSEILDILTKNPEVWKKTIFILTYDENDGYFDHIPPFTAPDPENAGTGKCSPGVNESGVEYIRLNQELAEGVSKKEARGGPIGLGFRVPMIIASPWSRGGKVCSQVFDHTSILQFLEDFLSKKFSKGVKETNISEWRRTVCGNLTSAFTLYDEKEKEKLPFLLRNSYVEKIYNTKFKEEPSNFKRCSPKEIAQINSSPYRSLSLQEPGLRPSRPLPYQLYAEGQLSSDKKNFRIIINASNLIFGNQSAGAPFKVYAPGEYLTIDSEEKAEKFFAPVRVWNYAVAAGDTLTEKWPMDAFKSGNYHLCVYGPNGFFREFKGNVNDPFIQIECGYQLSRFAKNNLTGNLELKLTNPDSRHFYNVKITDNAYQNKPSFKKLAPLAKETIVMNLKESFSWYDFSITIKEYPSFEKRYAGRVETGKENYSDPLIANNKQS